MALVVSFLALFLLWRYRGHFAGLVKNGGPPLSKLPRHTIASRQPTNFSTWARLNFPVENPRDKVDVAYGQ
jgi:hypothetical protein